MDICFIVNLPGYASFVLALRERLRFDEREEELTRVELLAPIRLRRGVHRTLVGRALLPAGGIAKRLAGKAILHLRALGQRGGQLDGVRHRSVGSRSTDDRARRIDVETVLFRSVDAEPVVALEGVPERID